LIDYLTCLDRLQTYYANHLNLAKTFLKVIKGNSLGL
jgi:hypothetical protein